MENNLKLQCKMVLNEVLQCQCTVFFTEKQL